MVNKAYTPNTIDEHIGQRMQLRRIMMGMSQKDFARMVGKTETEVSRWLGGTHNFTLKTIAKISSVLGCNLISV